MIVTEREAIYQALFDLVTPLRAAGAVDGFPDGTGEVKAEAGTPTSDRPFNLITREVIEVQRIPPGLQPVLMMYEFNENYREARYGMIEGEFQVVFILGATSERGTPGQSILNPCIDVLMAALWPQGTEVQTLGGIVDRVVIKGTAGKDHGNNSTKAGCRQASYYLPVSIFPIGAPDNG